MNEENGGPAFPVDQVEVHGCAPAMRHPGMSLRDYFAGQALNTDLLKAAVIVSEIEDTALSEVAQFCYRLADAMLKERGE